MTSASSGAGSNPAIPKLAYTLADVAEMTGFPLRPLLDDCRAGRIEHIRRGRERYMTPAQIRDLIEAHRVAAEQDPAQAAADNALAAYRERVASRLARKRAI